MSFRESRLVTLAGRIAGGRRYALPRPPSSGEGGRGRPRPAVTPLGPALQSNATNCTGGGEVLAAGSGALLPPPPRDLASFSAAALGVRGEEGANVAGLMPSGLPRCLSKPNKRCSFLSGSPKPRSFLRGRCRGGGRERPGPARPLPPPPPPGAPGNRPAMGRCEAASAGRAPALLPLLLLLAVARVRSLEIQAAPRARAFVGEAVVLPCWFRSSSPVSDKLTVDWTYRPLAGGAPEPIFHYQAAAYPARKGTFRDRVSWAGDVAKHDASIAIANPTMDDNGTFTCSVKNPPDVQHNMPETVLTVTHRGASFQLTLAWLLSALVFLPSAVVVALLLVRMGRKSGVLSSGKKMVSKKSSIEVVDEPEQRGCVARLARDCLQCLDTDEEDPY